MEERLKILRVMNEITGKVGLKEFTEMVGLTLGQTLGYLQGLVKAGFVRKVERRYSITEEGKIALKALSPVPEGMEFHFYTGIGQYTGLSAKTLKDFCELLKKVDVGALEFHVSRGDFENWITSVFGDKEFANEITRIRESKLGGESLRNEILGATEARYNKFGKLLAP
ncbi:MAG: DUF5752 family protein [Candidatus Bathyarchaeia archaeon]